MTCSKTAYGRRVAHHEAQRLRRETGEPFRAYACPECGRWHLTTVVLAGGGRDQARQKRRGQRTDGMSLEQVEEMARRMRGGG